MLKSQSSHTPNPGASRRAFSQCIVQILNMLQRIHLGSSLVAALMDDILSILRKGSHVVSHVRTNKVLACLHSFSATV